MNDALTPPAQTTASTKAPAAPNAPVEDDGSPRNMPVMIPLFLGLMLTNFIVLSVTFAIGFGAYEDGQPGDHYGLHISLGMGAGLTAALAHCAMYTYFMGTTKWLQAATDKAGLDPKRFVEPPRSRKRRAFFLMMTGVGITMITAFGGAATDTISWWPDHVHITLATTSILVNFVCAVLEYRLIRRQARNMDDALDELNAMPGVQVKQH